MAARISSRDRLRIGEILAGYGDWFSAQLVRLIAKADAENLELLRQVYPSHVAAYESWLRS